MRRSPSRSTGTTGFDPMYPMIPHIRDSPTRLSVTRSTFLRYGLLAFHPALDVVLTGARDAQCAVGHVLRDRGSSGHVGALAHAHGSDELRVAADERPVLDDRLVLLLAVVVAGDGPRADVDVIADGGVAEIRQVIHLRSGAERRLLQFDEVADLGALAHCRRRPEMGERS